MSKTEINHGRNDNRKAHPLLDTLRQVRRRVNETDRRIEFIPLARFTASKTNARTHSPQQVRQIAASISDPRW
jgi:hypothetical protein